jgi:hypothetical protein
VAGTRWRSSRRHCSSSKEWITIAWALEGAALAWLFVKIPHRGLYWSAVALRPSSSCGWR